ncbi:conjugal transfer mating pair stabilization protein TraN [Escherichia coli]|nr:conjugal transfer mating pair stabilization protein TraN [Escherichia coli]
MLPVREVATGPRTFWFRPVSIFGLLPIVQQQGRNGQLRISFGSAKHPDCRGITVDELQKIQFNRLDFTNFYEDLMNNQKIPDSGVLTQKVKEQIADQLKQAGQ